MLFNIKFLIIFFLFFFTNCFTCLFSNEIVDNNPVKVELLSSKEKIIPGEKFDLAIKLSISPNWYTYWINPGEVGYPTSIKLYLPDGFKRSKLNFPVPSKFISDYGGGIKEVSYGYKNEVSHTFSITASNDIKIGDEIKINGKVKWLMCNKSCIPGQKDVSLSLIVSDKSEHSRHSYVIKSYNEKVPKPLFLISSVDIKEKITIHSKLQKKDININFKDSEILFYPYNNLIFDDTTNSKISFKDGVLEIIGKKNKKFPNEILSNGKIFLDKFSGVISVKFKGKTYSYELVSEKIKNEDKVEKKSKSTSFSTLILMVFFAFIGGIILNIMPCVFPVISLKVMSFVGQAGEDRKKIFYHSLVFMLGVLVFFWILTMAMIILKSFGSSDLGWGVQLRQPLFVIILILIMVVVALSLFGTFEMGASMTMVGGKLVNKSGYSGSFWSGALAVLLATPCMGPFMAPAVTFAMLQSGAIMFLIFTFLGLGLASPYFLFALFPNLLNKLPPPGKWMDTFKQIMGFPMLAVAVWLIGVLSKQLNSSGIQIALASALLLSFSLWVIGKFANFSKPKNTRIKFKIIALLIIVLSFVLAWEASFMRVSFKSSNIKSSIKAAREKGKNVFVDFTAEWCVTCKVNESTAIKTEKVQEAFKNNNIEFIIADWTNEDPEITALIKEHGRSGVPLYVLYPSDLSKKPIILPDGLITPNIIIKSIENLKQIK